MAKQHPIDMDEKTAAERRYKKVFIPQDYLVDLVKTPPGTRAVWASGSFDPPGVVLVLHSPSWPIVDDASEAPVAITSVEVEVFVDPKTNRGWRQLELTLTEDTL